MPVYFVHLTEGDEFTPDREGIVRPDLAAVRQAAVEGASGLIAEAVRRGERDYRGRLDVEDEQRRKVLTVTFACPVQVDVTPPASGAARQQAPPDEDRPC